MKKYIVSTFLIFASVSGILAQYNLKLEDMLRVSQQYPGGTARVLGMGGAFGALGGDMSSLSLNPAGIGVYRSSEFTFTPSFGYNNSTSTLHPDASTTGIPYSNSDFSQKLNISNFGYVYTMNTDKEEGWVSASFGVAYNRLSDFNRSILIKTPSANSSLLDEFTYYANQEGTGPYSPGNFESPYYEGLAYQTYALDNILYSDKWWQSDYSYNHNYGEGMMRRRDISGGIGEYAFSFGGNYSNKLYLGMTLGIQSLYYKEVSTHSEIDANNSVPNLQSFHFTENFTMRGTGYNFKAGLVYRPVEFLRLGAAVHSPTLYNIDSEFYTEMESNYDNSVATDGNGNPITYSYGNTEVRANNNTLSTPWKFIGSAALQFGPIGILSVDYERLNYSNMRLKGDVSDFNNPNDNLSATYKSVDNLRVGAEIKLGEFAVRAGAGLYSTPYKDPVLKKIDYTTYSGGLGYRGKSFFFDLAYVYFKYNDLNYTLYNYKEQGGSTAQTWVNTPTQADIKNELNKFVATIGFKF